MFHLSLYIPVLAWLFFFFKAMFVAVVRLVRKLQEEWLFVVN